MLDLERNISSKILVYNLTRGKKIYHHELRYIILIHTPKLNFVTTFFFIFSSYMYYLTISNKLIRQLRFIQNVTNIQFFTH